MLVFILGIVVAFHVVSCQASLNPTRPGSSTNSKGSPKGSEHSEDKSTPQQFSEMTASLYVPGETDIVKLRSFVLSQRLERVTKASSSFTSSFHDSTPYASQAEEELDKNFMTSLTSGEFSKIDQYITQYSALLPSDPAVVPSPRILARLGFLNIWRFSERFRLLSDGKTFDEATTQLMYQSLGACAEYFTKATEIDLKNSVYRGFAADCNLAMSESPNGAKYGMKGLELAAQAIRRNPDFNLFTVAYVLTSLPNDQPEFNLGMEMMWKNLDVCFSTKVDRSNPNVSGYLKDFLPIGTKRFCLNSDISPHNFEGFFMIFGDLLVKAGQPGIAKIMYANAKLLPSFYTWPLRETLFQKIATADQNVAQYKLPVLPMTKPNYGTITFHTEKSCMVCHQK
jgi:hypothetical protein